MARLDMNNEDLTEQLAELSRSWKLLLALGVLTTILGIVVLVEPGVSLVVIAVLIGVELFVSGVIRLIRSLATSSETNRVLSAVIGIVLMLVGLFLIRHVDITLLTVAVLTGAFWIVFGIAEIFGIADTIDGLSEPDNTAGLWSVLLGIVTLLAGIVLLAYPVASLFVVALLAGIGLILRGLVQIGIAFALRNPSSRTKPAGTPPTSVPTAD